MDVFIHWAGFAGAWLLVAGPLFQATVELRAEEFDNQQFESTLTDIPKPQRISGWWWLLPPVAYVKNRRRSDAHRTAILAALKPELREQYVGFMNKATGWFTVAGGAFLIALKETWELVELYELPVAVYWVVIVVLSVAAITNTAVRTTRGDAIIHADEPEYAEKKKAERARQMANRRTKRHPPAGNA